MRWLLCRLKSDEQYLPASVSSRVVLQSPAYAYPRLAIQARMAPSGVANPKGRLADVGAGDVAIDVDSLGDVVDVGAALRVVIDGVDAFTVPVEVVIAGAVTDGDADPPTGALPQPATTNPTDVTADSSTVRVVRRLLDDSLPISTQ